MSGISNLWLFIGCSLHIIFTFFCVVSYQTGKHHVKYWWMNILLLLPIFNVILTVLHLDTVVGTYDRRITELECLTGELSRKVILLERSTSDLERRKFRRVRVGDVFMCPDVTGWVSGFRGQKHTIVEIIEDSYEKHPVITTNKKGVRYKNSWDSLRTMVFLSDEPVKPFEFLCEKE